MRLLNFLLILTIQINGTRAMTVMNVIKSVIDGIMDDDLSTSTPTNYPSLRTTDPTKIIPEDELEMFPTFDTELETNSPTSTPSKEPFATSSPTRVVTESQAPKPIFSPTVPPTMEPTNPPTLPPTMEATEPPTLEPTIEPTMEPTNPPTSPPTMEPTDPPTLEPTDKPTTASPTIASYKCSQEVQQYQLKMFWEKGIEWQESKKERAWCAECEDDCDNGDYIKIRECDDRDKDQDWLFYDCTVRPKRNPNLCFTAGESRNLVGRIRLRPCDDDEDLRQKFRLYDPDDRREKFQFKILEPGYEDICLTQEHHPRDKEDLRFYDCRVAYKNDRGVYDGK